MHALMVQSVDHFKRDLIAVLVLEGHQVGLIFLFGLSGGLVHIFCHKSRSPVKYLKNGITVTPCPLCSL